MHADQPRNRVELSQRLAELRSEGVIDALEETELMDHFDRVLRDVSEQREKLEVEYRRKLRDDGKVAADAWLLPLAEEIGRQQGRATRELTDRLKVVTG